MFFKGHSKQDLLFNMPMQGLSSEFEAAGAKSLVNPQILRVNYNFI